MHDEPDQGEHVEGPEQYRIVALDDGLVAQQAEAVQREDHLDQERAGKQDADERGGKAGDDDQHGVTVLGEGDYASLALGRRASAPVSFTFRAGSFEQPVYAGDVVDAIMALLEMTDAPELVELAGPERVTRRELTRRAGRALGRRTLLISLPIALGRMLAATFERLSGDPSVTRAMLDVLDHDDNVDVRPACESLGLELTALDETLRRCLRSPQPRA